MALINTLREKAGKVLVVAVGLAIVSFILADLLGSNSVLFGGQSNEVGEIAGRKITYQDFQQRIEDMKNNYVLNTGRNPSEAEMTSIRQQAWELLIVDIAFEDQYEALGLTVSDEEKIDMVQGNNIHPDLVRAFTNPETGEFDKSQIINFLQNFAQLPPQNQQQWDQMEQSIYQARKRLKYDNLFIKTNYVTDAEAKRLFSLENTAVEAKYLYVPFYSISDSAVTVTDAELNQYIKEHEAEYKVEESRSLKYVSIPFVPSAEDTASYNEELTKLVQSFETVDNDSSFARLNSDFPQAYQSYSVGQLPEILQENFAGLQEGEVFGPNLEGGSYKLYKVSEVYEDSISSARASHILFKGDDSNPEAKQQAKQNAQETLQELKAGADFAQLARTRSEDGSSQDGGDLGWFTEGRMVAPFSEAVFNANNTGLLNEIIETEYGYHIINVTATATNKSFKIATIEREIIASDATRDEAFRRSDYFAGISEDLDDFMQNAQNDSLTVLDAENISSDARRIGMITNAREVVRWLFTEASVGKVSEVFELDEVYLVAVMTEKVEEGIAPLSMVREAVAVKVKNQKKARIITDKLAGLSGTLEEIAEAYGSEANVHTAPDVKLNSNNLPSVGVAPVAVGKLFGLEAGEKSEPVIADNGVVILETVSVTEAPEIADYSSYKNRIKQMADNATSFSISEAIKENADIEDERYRFY